MRQRFALGLIALLASACGITARSDDFRCAASTECPDGRICLDGWCVTGHEDGGSSTGDGGSAADARAADAGSCPAACDRCQRDICIIECNASGACRDLVVCPAGLRCQVACSGVTSCQSGVDCSEATGCDIRCSQTGACAGPVVCGAGRCDVACSGSATCSTGIDCSGSCRCDTDCSGIGACSMEPSCPFSSCVDGIDCTDVGQACHECQ